MSPKLVGVYWRLQYIGVNDDRHLHAREIGSSNPSLGAERGLRLIPGFPLNVDEDKEVEFRMPGTNASSWVFGFVEESTRRSRSKVMKT